MATPFLSIKTLLNQAALVTPEQFEMWGKQWRTAVEGGSDDSLMTSFSREKMENVDVKMLKNLCLLARSNVIAPKDSHMIE